MIDLRESISCRIRKTLKDEIPFLSGLPEETVSGRRNHQMRTAKELIGHLIDSASNNHQRIVRLQYNEKLVFPDYRHQNDLWIALQNYNEAPWTELLQLWKHYNLHLARVIENTDISKLGNTWLDSEGEIITLERMMENYTGHMDLHIKDVHDLVKEQNI